MIQRIFPFIIITLSALASLVYFIKGDIRHGLYWAFATAINLTVTI